MIASLMLSLIFILSCPILHPSTATRIMMLVVSPASGLVEGLFGFSGKPAAGSWQSIFPSPAPVLIAKEVEEPVLSYASCPAGLTASNHWVKFVVGKMVICIDVGF